MLRQRIATRKRAAVISCLPQWGNFLFATPIIVDPVKIAEKIRYYEAEIIRLTAFLDGFGSLQEFAVAAKNGKGRGQPPKDNPLLEPLRKFVASQREDFNFKQLKTALKNPTRRDQLRAAVRQLEVDGLLEVIEKPMGLKKGIYRPIVVEKLTEKKREGG